MAERSSLHLLVINEFFWPDVCASSAVLTDHLPRIAALRPDWRVTALAGNRAWDRPEVTWPARERFGAIDIVRVPRPALGRGLWRRGLGFAMFHRGVTRLGRHLERPDVIMASTAPPLGGRLGAALADHFKCPLIYKVLDLYPDCAAALDVIRPGGLIDRAWRRIDVAAMRRSAAVVGISEGIVRRLTRTRDLARPGGGSATRVRLIFDGFDPRRVRPVAHEQNVFRRACGLHERFVVQYAGNMGRSHPFDAILTAARALRGDPRFAFQFIGVGPGRAVIERAMQLDLADPARADPPPAAPVSTEPATSPSAVMQLLDYQPAEQLAEVLSAADAALISQAEGMAELSLPYKFYGILAAGRPLIFVGPRESEIVRYTAEAGCGLHVEQGDAAGLAAALRRLADDPDARREMGRRARELFEARFTSDRAATAWTELIEQVR